jgi:acyl-CoA thioesterase
MMPNPTRPHPFDAATGVRPIAPHRWRGPLDHGWFGPAGPHGGHLAAQLLRVIGLEARDPGLAPHSLSVYFLEPGAPGELDVDARVERRGRSLTTVTARATQQGRPIATAVAALGRQRVGPSFCEARMPQVPAPDRLPGPSSPAREGRPRVGDHYDVRFAIGRPYSGGAARAGGWIRLREPRASDALLVTALTDMWMPSALMRLPEPAAAPTIELTVNYFGQMRGGEAGAWFLVDFRTPVAEGGYFREEGAVWAADGTLLARSSQLGVLLTNRSRVPGAAPPR